MTATSTLTESPTYTEVIQEEPDQATQASTSTNTTTLRLRLTNKSSKTDRRVSWTTDTVDNEFMNKKKSKCCCIYTKPKNFDESSSEDENGITFFFIYF
jgi:protein phosphatase 1 regulatory subunit 11